MGKWLVRVFKLALRNLPLLVFALPITAFANPDIEAFVRGNTYFARVRPNTDFPADCSVQFNVGGRAYLNDISGSIFSEALGGSLPLNGGEIIASGYCSMSAAEQGRRETRRKQDEFQRQVEEQRLQQQQRQQQQAQQRQQQVWPSQPAATAPSSTSQQQRWSWLIGQGFAGYKWNAARLSRDGLRQ